jgi:peptidoglycan/LPS O-acetylase OafA/YrhL
MKSSCRVLDERVLEVVAPEESLRPSWFEAQPTTSEPHRIQHIDAWRFIAVSLVILGHFLVYGNFSFLVTTYPFLRRLGPFGELGVLIFFFISGFVICIGLTEERAVTLRVSLKAFYVRRALRIMPPLYFYLRMVCTPSAAARVNA